jgi:coenzyme PQQ precursor peptide PqqA
MSISFRNPFLCDGRGLRESRRRRRQLSEPNAEADNESCVKYAALVCPLTSAGLASSVGNADHQEIVVMAWKKPVIIEIAVGCEINAYACAEVK